MLNDNKQLAKQSANAQTSTKTGTLMMVKGYLNNEAIRNRFNEILKDKAPGFVQSIISLVSSSTNFNGVDPNTIIASAFQAATLDLPINPNLGFAYIIPYGRKAQFQMGYKGFIQLALRTGQYKTINATEICEGELVEFNRITGIITIDPEKKKSDKIIGYAAYFQLTNGFEKQIFMSYEDLLAHGRRYSKSFNSKEGLWQKNPHVMMLKTVLKLLLSKYGILSVQLEKAIQADQAIITEDEQTGEVNFNYEDNSENGETEFEIFGNNQNELDDYFTLIDGFTEIKQINDFKRDTLKNFNKEQQRELENKLIEAEERILESKK